MKVLHTSDWHLGRLLHARRRYREFEDFLDWMAATIERSEIDCLLVAGDIFDTTTPSHRSQELYFRFLTRVSRSSCRHVVVIAGNHDSPSLINAPRSLLEALNIYVVGSVSEKIDDEIIVLRDGEGRAEAVVCAVPYLHDRFVRGVEAGESPETKEQKLLTGIVDHYQEVAKHSQKIRDSLDPNIPLIAMGHLFTAGGLTVDGDGVRGLYVGTITHINPSVLADNFDYVALGHLHVPQRVGGSDSIRYSGSPLPMGFGEARQQKSVVVVTFEGRKSRIETVDIPQFQRLERVEGDYQSLLQEIERLKGLDQSIWVEVIHTGNSVAGDLREAIEEVTRDSKVEVLKLKDLQVLNAVLEGDETSPTLDELTTEDVFIRLLEASEVDKDQRDQLLSTYFEALRELEQQDLRAE
ncbi:MAG: exonuclease SbcCD subunit D C-terminal domain-containing protein [Actinomycetota bacterium]|nr:exonuclease SbcCD subunit D C-terminal domain-containing protein [Actinomycetota bacterium]